MHAQPIKLLDLLNAQVQYVIPRWQRRYCWDQSDIERLVEDLTVVADARTGSAHYTGTMLTFPEPGAAGVVSTIRVVDGQQRLTTVSILLACIAEELGPDGECEEWTSQVIRDDRLTNPGKSAEKYRKLRLQDGDEDEYRRGLDGEPSGMGAITQAWKIARRLVAREGVDRLLKGLNRLSVVSIGLDESDDPQQIFESLNATGRPLQESEKVKNWLLMGLPDSQQQDLYENHWLQIENHLDATHSTEFVDMFLRDLLRWRTGKTLGIDRVYEGIRRWAVRTGQERNRPSILLELARLAELYGMIAGTAKSHIDAKVELELRHLREMEIDVHRPLTLRLLNDAEANNGTSLRASDLAKILEAIGTWTTRIWLADVAAPGLNTAMAELAHGIGPEPGADPIEHWLGRINRLRNRRFGVPGDREVRDGIRTKRAYGKTAPRSARAVLCALMEAEHKEEAPDRTHLTIEHIMPKKLTNDWKRELGAGAEEVHRNLVNCLSNLTLSGDTTNSKMGAKSFAAKKAFYRKSPIGMTSRLACEEVWNAEALKRRAEDIAVRALARWPWREERFTSQVDDDSASASPLNLRWRMDEGSWQNEQFASEMVKNVAATLLSLNPENALRLSGDAISANVHHSNRYPSGYLVGSLKMHAVPGHPDYVMYPFERDIAHSAKRCKTMGQRCGVVIQVDFNEDHQASEFWRLLKDTTGGLPGQKPSWQGPSQTTMQLNRKGGRIGLYIGNHDKLWLFVTEIGKKNREQCALRMRRYSHMIIENMSDQNLSNDMEKECLEGRSIRVWRAWTRDDEQEWPEVAEWVKIQCDRMQSIIAD